LLEEKWDAEGTTDAPYSFLFHELAETPAAQADRVETAIKSMIEDIRKLKDYGEVLDEPIRLKQASTYLTIVKRLAKVSFNDCDLDAKGTAFEYFVRATLKGKKLGQYFTPRPLVRLMLHLGQWQQILANLKANEPFKVLDPACGTGGFLVFAMNSCLRDVDQQLRAKKIHPTLAEKLRRQLQKEVFYGIDANESVACSAKMNMIVAGDGHTTIKFADSLSTPQLIPDYKLSDGTTENAAQLILTNPPFGTSESESLSAEARKAYAIQSTKGQALFVQKMIMTATAGSRVVTVIDDGVLNTASYLELRRHLLEKCRIESVIQLPDETFKPNKITVRSSVLTFVRRDVDDPDFADKYPIAFIRLASLGYEGSGAEIRGFKLDKLIEEVTRLDPYQLPQDTTDRGYNWMAFACSSASINTENRHRLDLKYWEPEVVQRVLKLQTAQGTRTIRELNQIKTRRGDSPPITEYVSETEGYALVVKSGSNINKHGQLVPRGDFIEEAVFEEYKKKKLELKDGDILLASTGEGTLGKCCVFRLKKPAIPEGHVTVIRVDQNEIYPEYLCDYLRRGFGAAQMARLFTGSTGMVEVTPEDVDRILVPKFPERKVQQSLSDALRQAEADASAATKDAAHTLAERVREFAEATGG
jgi:type I restriction enzyme M protein